MLIENPNAVAVEDFGFGCTIKVFILTGFADDKNKNANG
jgi:hypothetical protein